jgi:hypothetical protein
MLPGLWLPLYIENIFKTAIKFILPYFLDRNAFKYHCKILTDDLNRVNSKEIVSILLYGYDFFVCVLGYTDEGLTPPTKKSETHAGVFSSFFCLFFVCCLSSSVLLF